MSFDTSLNRPGGVAVTTRVTLDGDFFRRDPGKTLYANIRDMLDGLAEEMQKAVRSDIEARQGAMPYWTGWTRDHVYGYTTSTRTGKRWATWAAVTTVTTGMGAKEAIRTKAAAASIERRFHPFRRVKSAVYRMRPVLTANLTRGLE